MTYLSRIRINPLRAASRSLLANPRKLHGAVLGGIAEKPTDERILWRLDSDNPRRPVLFVLTRSKPDWTHIIEQAGWPDADGEHAAVRDYTPLLAQIAHGREFAFRLTASPVQNTSTPDKPTPNQAARTARGDTRSHRIGHRTAAAQLKWFLERTARWGFDIPESRTDTAAPGITPVTINAIGERQEPGPAHEVRITARNRHSFSKNRNKPPVVLHTATFEGRLRVTDPQQLTHQLTAGIGPSKAYGCGLLTLAPLPGEHPDPGGR
ncbi:type I-E CRISPR-associated protein Cas6/Cse3/CasE [Saccharopolyspora sp. K220]|uniref:type I-E CRISPR-associated protein Cas6/Cse3/CasE n=1 Tax=Saccharopolyspora soli TaxID=2926618 RepID=UPI001F583EDF|nr:type I-E CRISPR-associated protein Cas6/Cse3/CasE [Saccharopolyspora soli]MCI2422150.1 type I-E CRISPR-associated protein Cas6/Cse3/CasE [Saccharopolyspora soli]